jgi:hypothetical protein
LEVADIFRDHGAARRIANAGHVSLDQLIVMSAIERCRTMALGGHVSALRELRQHCHCAKLVRCSKAAEEWAAESTAGVAMLRNRHAFACGPGSSPSGRPNGHARRKSSSARFEGCFPERNCCDR